jgi:hypothetical protein
MKMAKEALAILEVPKKYTAMLPGHDWRPPDKDVVKINTDGGLSFDTRRGGAGGVVRSRYAYQGAWSKPYNGFTGPLVAEALALRDDVIIAKLRGYPKVVMETDCLEIVNLWKHSPRIARGRGFYYSRNRRASFEFFFFYYSACNEISKLSGPPLCKAC